MCYPAEALGLAGCHSLLGLELTLVRQRPSEIGLMQEGQVVVENEVALPPAGNLNQPVDCVDLGSRRHLSRGSGAPSGNGGTPKPADGRSARALGARPRGGPAEPGAVAPALRVTTARAMELGAPGRAPRDSMKRS